MKKILITISVLVLIGFASSILLAKINMKADLVKSFIWGLNDAKSGLITIVVLWGIYFAHRSYKDEVKGIK